MTTDPVLDSPDIRARLDPSGMRERIAGLADQCRRAWEQSRAFPWPPLRPHVERVAVLGMGGSAIGGDLLADLASHEGAVPVTVVRDYSLPPEVDSHTLAIASSYSGETEETLAATEEAVHRGAQVVAVTSGGTLAKRCQEMGLPWFRVDYSGEPRCALGYSFVVPLALMCLRSIMADKAKDMEEALSLLERQSAQYRHDVPIGQNPAKSLARELHGKPIVIYGGGLLSGAARRWKTQFNENAKAWAFYELLPEAHHNSVVGYSHPLSIGPEVIALLLRPATVHPRLALRYEITGELLDRACVAHHVVEAQGRSALAQVLSTVFLGDYASYYLALLYGVDPSPVAAVDYLKGRLSKREGAR